MSATFNNELLRESVELERETAIQVMPSPMSMIQMAVAKGADMEVIKGLVQLQREERQYQAELEFNEAMQRAQSKMRRIGVDATNPQTRSKYATYAKLDAAVRPIYTEEGFALSFDEGEAPAAEVVRVLCYVSHKSGFTRTYKKDISADGKGAKGGDVMTKTHASGAAVSYGMRYLLKMIFNVAVGETDDDGNLGQEEQQYKEMDLGEYERFIGLMEAAETVPMLRETYRNALKAAGPDAGAKTKFLQVADKRANELKKAGAQ